MHEFWVSWWDSFLDDDQSESVMANTREEAAQVILNRENVNGVNVYDSPPEYFARKR